MADYNYIRLQYVPNYNHSSRAGQHSKHRFLHQFAYTETVSGVGDNTPTLLFYAPFALLKDVCLPIYKMMDGRVEDFKIIPSHACRRKNGKCYWRVEVQIIGLDEQFISFEELTQLIVARMQRLCNCKIVHQKMPTFLNT